MTKSPDNPIIFVGAGPGDPDLITVAGRKALEAADLTVYAGSLVSKRMLAWCRPEAELMDSAGLHLDQFMTPMLAAQKSGRRVVRLHTGDPSLFGAIAEQLAVLRREGVAYRIIPGVTAAFAAAAALGVEYTLPERCQSLIFTRASGRTPTPEKEDLALLAAHGAGLAVYLSARLTDKVSRDLSAAYGPDAPVAVVYRASWPDERIVWTTAAKLPEAMAASGVDRQALILAGPGVAQAFTGEEVARSHLYDPAFSHGYRRGEGR